MTLHYEIWQKDKYGSHFGSKTKPDDTCYTLDTAIKKAEELSKKLGKTTFKTYNWMTGQEEDASVDNLILVVERGGKITRIRGIGIGGKFIYARECKRCHNSGMDANHYLMTCKACSGASYGWRKP